MSFLKKYFSKEQTLEEKLKKQNQEKSEQILKKPEATDVETKIFKGLKNFAYFFKSFWVNDDFNYLELEEKLEELLISCDFSAALALKISEEIIDDLKFSKTKNSQDVKTIMFKKLMEVYGDIKVNEINFFDNKCNIWLICGTNGSGKTTTIAKLAHFYKQKNKKVLLIAGDTYRAGAVEQLQIWSEKIGLDIIIPQKEKEDPASLIYKSLSGEEKYDLILCDTSGRQHNNKNLMQEISKIYSVIHKFDENAPHESLVVIDSTIGQSSFFQAEMFLQNAKTTGIVLTKLDNSNRGGIIFAIKQKYNIPVKFIGVGEQLEDLYVCDIEKIIDKFVSLFFDNDEKKH